MKNLIKFSIVMVVLCITACTQTFENTSNEVQKKAQGRLVMKVGNESRTIKPTIGESDVKTAVLTANGKEIKSWSGENIIYQIQNSGDILLDVGDYNFTMTFYNAEGTEILTASTSQGIVAGDNILDFDMKPVTNGYGNISITLTWDVASGINKIKAGLYYIATNKPLEGFEDRELDITTSNEQKSTATYSPSEVPVGQYIIKFKIYAGETAEKHLNTLSEVINVAAGITTSSQITLSQINTQYSITYNPNGGTWTGNFIVTDKRNANKKITLPTANDITREGYEFAGWYDNDNNRITEIPSDTAKNISVTAKWLQLYTITYNLNGGENNTNNPTSYTVETETITLGDPTKNDTNSTFLGWYNESGDKITEIAKGSTGNITVTARWRTTCTVNNVSSVITSLSGEGPHDIVVTKAITSDTITTIKSALDTLKQSNNSAKVNLDLSGTTGLTSIGVSAFFGCGSLTSVTIPDSVTEIGNHAFNGCGLKSVTIGNGVKKIGDSAFCNCSSLTSVTIGDSVTTIDNYAFGNCSSLTSVTFADNSQLTKIGDSAFSHCSQLTSITFPESVTTIGINVFDACSELTSFIVHESNQNFSTLEDGKILCDKNKETLIAYPSAKGYVTILNGIKTIAGNAFIECKELTEISIPDSVTTICDGAFANTGFISVSLPDSITEIGINVFFGCSSLETVKLPNKITSIPNGTFFVCSSLSNIEIPDDVTSIGVDAFSYCNSVKTLVTGNSLTSLDYLPITSALESITIGDGITEIGDNKFKDFTNLKSVTFASNSQLATIGENAFQNCSNLTSINIPDGVSSIEANTFNGCSSLTEITIPDGVTSIGDNAFESCSNLTSIIIPDDVTSIGGYAFAGCSDLTSLTIGSSVTTINASAFCSCSNLTEFIVQNSNFSTLENGKILCDGNGKKLISYPSASGSVTIPYGITTIGDYAFENCTSLTQITIPDNVGTIGRNAFTRTGLTSVVLPDSITEMGINVFWECSNLETVTLSNSITSIPDSTFFMCHKLSEIVIPEGVKSIKYDAFCRCSSLTSIVIPASVTSIIRGAFFYSGLTTVNYRGTEEEWNSINIDSTYNDRLISATKNYDYTGE